MASRASLSRFSSTGRASRNFPNVQLPSLPPKWGSLFKSPEKLARDRQPLLDAFLQAVFRNPEIFTTWEIQNFLGIDSHIAALAPIHVLTPEGTLYVKVVEARNLPDIEPGKTVSPYTELYIVAALNQPQRTSVLKTEVYEHSSNPKWFEEMLFSIMNRHMPIRIQVWDYRFLLSDRPLGHIELDLRPLEDFKLYDVWLPLLGATPGEMHVLCQFTPMKIHKPIHTKLKPFRIHLEKTEYHPGEVVRGMLICNVGKPLSARQVFVRLLGLTETHWEESRTETYTDAQGRTQTRVVTDHYGQSFKLIDEARIMWDYRSANNGESKMLSGSYCWPFEFLLPPKLPPSFRCSTGWITYEVKAEIDKPGIFAFNTRINVPLRIVAPYASANPIPATYGRLQRIPFRSNDQTVYIQGKLNGNISYLGEQQTLTLLIENNSRKDVLDAEIALVGTVVCKAHGRTHVSTINALHVKLKHGSGFPVRAGTSNTVEVSFHLPPDLPPSLPPDLSPLIDLNYVLHITCDISGFLTGYAKADIPVIVSHPLPQIAAVPQPVAYPTIQPDINMMVDYGYGLPRFSEQYYSPIPQQQYAPSYLMNETQPDMQQQPMFSAPPPTYDSNGQLQMQIGLQASAPPVETDDMNMNMNSAVSMNMDMNMGMGMGMNVQMNGGNAAGSIGVIGMQAPTPTGPSDMSVNVSMPMAPPEMSGQMNMSTSTTTVVMSSSSTMSPTTNMNMNIAGPDEMGMGMSVQVTGYASSEPSEFINISLRDE